MSDLDLENELLGSDDELASEPDVADVDESDDSSTPEQKAASKTPPTFEINGTARLKSISRGPSREPDTSRNRREDTPQSVGSAAMSESEDEAPAPTESKYQPAAEYKLEGVFIDEKDRAEIMALPEVRREQILAERAEARQQDDFVARLRQKAARDQEEKGSTEKKRKATDVDLEDSPRKTARSRANDKLENYKRQREQKQEQRQRGEGYSARTQRRSDSFSDRSSEGEAAVESDYDYEKPSARQQSTTPRVEGPASLRDFLRVQIGRSNFIKVCHTPGFEDTVDRCYTRIAVHPDPVTRRMVYKMAQIKGIKTGKLYKMEGSNGKHLHMDQYVVVTMDGKERSWSFTCCSDSPFTTNEFEQYKQDAARNNQKLATTSQLEKKCEDIGSLLNHQWTDLQITEKLKKISALQQRDDSYRLARLQQERVTAVQADDEAKVASLEAEIKKLEPKVKSASNVAPAKLDSQQQLAKRNEMIRRQNAENTRANELAFFRQQKQAKLQKRREAMVKKAAEEAAASASEDDLFGDKELVAAPTSNGVQPSKKKKKTDDEVFADMGLDIDIEI